MFVVLFITGVSMKDKIAEMLGIIVPEKYEIEYKDVTYISADEVKSTVWEKSPQLYINEAVLVKTKEDENYIFGKVKITESMCEGHFDFFKMLPLAVLAQALGQLGELLILLKFDDGSGNVPLVAEASGVKAISSPKDSKRNHRFMVPGDDLFMVVRLQGSKFNLYFVDAETYVQNDKMATIEKISYISVNKSYFVNGGGNG